MKPEDLKGYKLRMFQAEAPIKAVGRLRRQHPGHPWPDTYTALATGTVDGLTTVLSASYLTKQTEAARFFTNVGEYYQIVVPVMSKRTWDKLTPAAAPDLRDRREGSGREVSGGVRGERDEYDRKAQNDHGVTIITPPMKPWLDVAKTVFERFENENILPKGLVGQVRRSNRRSEHRGRARCTASARFWRRSASSSFGSR
jgi:TRAP-type C4-dicarboxylate transport system substrate-binding protein